MYVVAKCVGVAHIMHAARAFTILGKSLARENGDEDSEEKLRVSCLFLLERNLRKREHWVSMFRGWYVTKLGGSWGFSLSFAMSDSVVRDG